MSNELLDDLNDFNDSQEPKKSDEELELLKLKKYYLIAVGIGIVLFFVGRYYLVLSWDYYGKEGSPEERCLVFFFGGLYVISMYQLVVWMISGKFLRLPLKSSVEKKINILFVPIFAGVVTCFNAAYSMVVLFVCYFIAEIIKYLFGIGVGRAEIAYFLDFVFLISLIVGFFYFFKDSAYPIESYYKYKEKNAKLNQ